MIQPFKSSLVLSIALLLSLSRGKSTKTRKTKPSSLASNDYQETCFDVEPERCQNFDFYCGTRPQYMSKNCKLTCKMCVPGNPVTDLSSQCGVDLGKRQETLCIRKEWVSICPHSCREFICDNKAEDCEALANKGGCLSQHKYMTENCKLTCAMCTPGDPVMDESSECNLQKALCNDWEWKRICPHTCRQYIQPPGQQNPYPQPQQAGSVVQPQQPQQPQQPVQQPVVSNQPQVSPQVGTRVGTAVQTSQLQPQVQQPVIPNQSQVSSATQPAPQVTSLTQPSQVQPQIQQTTSQVNPAIQTSQVQPQIQPTVPQVPSAPQPLQLQPQVQQTTPQVNPVMQTNQLQPQMQPTVSQAQPLYVQQQVQQPNQVQYPAGQPQVPQTSYQPQVNPGQGYQPVIQQPQFGTVGPMKKQKEPNPAKGSTVDEKSSNPKETVKKRKAKKANLRRKVKTAEGSKAKDKENERIGKNTNQDLKLLEKIYSKKKKCETPLKEESRSAAMPINIEFKKTNTAYDKG